MDDSTIPQIAAKNIEMPIQQIIDLKLTDNSITDITNKCIKPPSPKSESHSNLNNKSAPVIINNSAQENVQTSPETEQQQQPPKPRAIPKITSQVENTKPVQIIPTHETETKKRVDEMKVKTRNAKVMDVKCDVLQISLAKNIKKSPIKLVQVDQWEDLVNSDEESTSPDSTVQKHKTVIPKYDDYDPEELDNLNNDQLEHIVEIYDFPSTFKTPDIMQIYNEMDQDSMYIKWLSETRALLVLGSAMQAKRALGIENPFLKSRPAALGSHLALEAVRTSNLRPAMKRPQTSMQAARRMITTALGAKSTVSREVQQRERDALRKAKEEKRNQRQSERDAWEGNPRPTSA